MIRNVTGYRSLCSCFRMADATGLGNSISLALTATSFALLITVAASDLALVTFDLSTPLVSYWLLIAAVAAGVVATMAGLVPLLSLRVTSGQDPLGRLGTALLHFGGMSVALTAALASLVLRRADPSAVTAWEIALAALAAGLMGCIPLFSGEPIYRHGLEAMRRHPHA